MTTNPPARGGNPVFEQPWQGMGGYNGVAARRYDLAQAAAEDDADRHRLTPPPPPDPHYPDVGVAAQQAAERHLAACMEALDAEQEGDLTVESPASAPFCGCDTCYVREVLHAAWPTVEADIRAELTGRDRLQTRIDAALALCDRARDEGAVLSPYVVLLALTADPAPAPADRCDAAANQRGEHISCDLPLGHGEQAHSNTAHSLIWAADPAPAPGGEGT